jgi:uncharacterized membrane protein YcaP (DUF421 family)
MTAAARAMLDWGELFGVSVSPLELIVRGTCMYWFLFALFRFVVRRDIGTIGVADILVLVIVADAAQNAMAGEYKTITDGMVLVATIVFWNYLTDRLSYAWPRFRRLAQPPPLLLIKEGRIQKGNLRREYVSEEELMAKLREKGIDQVSQVKRAYLEPDGEISVIKRQGGDGHDDVDDTTRNKAAAG